jgi:hypothetical protein
VNKDRSTHTGDGRMTGDRDPEWRRDLSALHDAVITQACRVNGVALMTCYTARIIRAEVREARAARAAQPQRQPKATWSG